MVRNLRTKPWFIADHNHSSVLYCADLHLCAIANARLGYSENFHLLCRKYHQHAPRERHLNGNTITCLCQSMYIYISFIIIFRHVIIYKVTIDALHVIHCLRCFTEIFLKSKRTKIPLTTIWYIYNLCIWNPNPRIRLSVCVCVCHQKTPSNTLSTG